MKTLLILRLSALGDIIHTMPAVLALRQSLGPELRIGWVVEEPFAELVERVGGVDAVFRVATKRWRRELLNPSTWNDLLRLRERLRAFAGGQTSIDFQGLVKSALLGGISGARRRFGFARDSVRESLSTTFYTDEVSVDHDCHVVEWNLRLARAAGAEATSVPRPDYAAFAESDAGLLEETAIAGRVVLLPGAGQEEKRWNNDLFTILAERLAKLLGSDSILVAWGPGEQHLADAIAKTSGAGVAPPTNLRQLAYLLQRARLVVAADTGPLHLADALGTRVVGLFGPTDPRRNGPYGQLDHCVETFSTSRSMSDISVDAVMHKVEEVLS